MTGSATDQTVTKTAAELSDAEVKKAAHKLLSQVGGSIATYA